MTTIRPYFKLSVADLESIFEAGHTDMAICLALIEELSHRGTQRSEALFKRVQQATQKAHKTSPSPTPRSTNAAEAVTRKDAPVATPASTTAQPPATAASLIRTPRVIPAESNKPASILAAWTALEALSPQTYRRPSDLAKNGDSRCVAAFDGEELPWFRGERSRPKQQLYYQVVLGCIPIDRATEELIKTFGEDEERGRKEREKAALAAVLVDRNGLLLENNAVAVSSFGWALPIALTGDLESLGAWTTAEKGLVEGLTQKLSRTDRNGNPLPLDGITLRKAFQWLVDTLRVPDGLYEEPSFVLRVFHYFKSKNPPEVALLNSFYLADLARAARLVDSNGAGRALARYIGLEQVEQSSNLLENYSLIERLVAPAQTPTTRWPALGGHPLVTLQQAAVNAARSELAADGAGIIAVNGPPGTGKTTLLRDIVASCVMDRATAMADFDDPLSAFRTTGQKVAAGDRAFLHLYRLDDSLKGHEVLVASSNNKAVENVSKELPSLKAVGRELRYFKTVSDRLLSRQSEGGEWSEGEPTWGLAAAVLGNALNRNAFQQALWWDDDRSLRLYLKAAKGDDVTREVKDESGRLIRREVPTIIQAECPPTPEQAKGNWRKARGNFKALKSEVETELSSLEAARKICLQLVPARSTVSTIRAEKETAASAKIARDTAVASASSARRSSEAAAKTARQRERQAHAERPGWLHRLFNTNRNQCWRNVYAPLAVTLAETERRAAKDVAAHEEAKLQLRQAEAALRSANEKLASVQAKLSSIESSVEQYRQRMGDRLVDEKFFQQGHESWNLASPWISDELHRKREDLFAAALELHRAFIDVTAQKISHNLGVLMGAMYAGAFQEDAKRALLGDLWSTLFLVCPVVSTTFASVDRMLGDLPPSSLGWVLVDEAGQATPQSAVGTLMRAKKAIVVGDPLQIPPVVSLPQRLIVEVSRYFGVTPAEWLAPEASVQTLADQSSRLKAEFRADVGIREVGIPLLVHRRCQEPMFGISNRIAYDGQMVHAATQSTTGPVERTLGSSGWFDVDAPAESKWCPAEGDVVVRLLNRLAAAGVQQPDVYIITPFRIIAQELRRRIEQEPDLLQKLGVDRDDWLRNRVGTIHTFQGKEAEAVIAVLGAPMAAQLGARRWAASAPNILNVMVSRAKQTLYVVGSRAAWSTVGHGKAVASALQTKT